MKRQSYTAFEGAHCITQGNLPDVVIAVKRATEAEPDVPLLIFDDRTGRVVDVDLRGTDDEILARLEPAGGKRGRGRPRLGVVGREVTLLPRHWEWLAAQPGGVSVTLRKLVEEARRHQATQKDYRKSQDRAYQFAVAIAGDFPDFEESVRALFAGDKERLLALTESWPSDVVNHIVHLAFTLPEENS